MISREQQIIHELVKKEEGNLILSCGDPTFLITKDINTKDLATKCLKIAQDNEFQGVNLKLQFRALNGKAESLTVSTMISNFVETIFTQDSSMKIYLTIFADELLLDFAEIPSYSLRDNLLLAVKSNQDQIDRLLIYYNVDPLAFDRLDNFYDVFGTTDFELNQVAYNVSMSYLHSQQVFDFKKMIPIKPITEFEPQDVRITENMHETETRTKTLPEFTLGYVPFTELDIATTISNWSYSFVNISTSLAHLNWAGENFSLTGMGGHSFRVDSFYGNGSLLYENNFTEIKKIIKGFNETLIEKQSCLDTDCYVCGVKFTCDVCLEGFYLYDQRCWSLDKETTVMSTTSRVDTTTETAMTSTLTENTTPSTPSSTTAFLESTTFASTSTSTSESSTTRTTSQSMQTTVTSPVPLDSTTLSENTSPATQSTTILPESTTTQSTSTSWFTVNFTETTTDRPSYSSTENYTSLESSTPTIATTTRNTTIPETSSETSTVQETTSPTMMNTTSRRPDTTSTSKIRTISTPISHRTTIPPSRDFTVEIFVMLIVLSSIFLIAMVFLIKLYFRYR